jgi:NodT family efflux transporter outer membrane factor (OMF) lipoprotein
MFIVRAALLMLLFLTGCSLSMSKDEITQNMLSAPSLKAEGPFVKGNWPQKKWWERYEESELNDLIAIALQNNPTIQAAKERIEAAKSKATIARSDLFPLVYFETSDQLEYLSKNGLYRALNPEIPLSNQQIDFSLSFAYEFDFWGKYRNLFKAALERQQAAIAEKAQTELIISTAIAQAYFGLKACLEKQQFYQELYEVRKSYFELEVAMLQNSLYSKLQPLLSEEAAFQAQQWLYAIEKEIETLIHVINILVGKGPDESLALHENLAPLSRELVLPENLSSELLSRRPDLMALIARVEALAHEVGAARADYWPNINLSGFLGFQSGSWGKLFEWASKTIGALPGLTLPVYTAGKIGANIDLKKAEFNEAVYLYNDLILRAFQQTADVLSIGKEVYGKKEKQVQIVRNAKERYELTQLRRKSGLDDAFASFRFLEELIQKQIEDVELLFQQYLVSVNLIKVLGGGYEQASYSY